MMSKTQRRLRNEISDAYLQGWKLAALVAVALPMGACAKNNVGADGAMGAAATPAASRIRRQCRRPRIFESDQTELSPQAINTPEKQAQWLQTYNRYPSPSKAMTSAAPANTNRARCAARPVSAAISPRAASIRPHAHDPLRQGAPGRSL
jgi:hypothetical protein